MRNDQYDFKFLMGHIVHHKRYGYRGVIYDVDDSCQADEAWYNGNQSQPDMNQPWYHLLVDGEDHVTYVAEENLELDEAPIPIEHPMIPQYFSRYEAGKYRRQLNA